MLNTGDPAVFTLMNVMSVDYTVLRLDSAPEAAGHDAVMRGRRVFMRLRRM